MRRPSQQAKLMMLGLLKTATAFASNPSRYPNFPSLFGSLSAATTTSSGRSFVPNDLLNTDVHDLQQVRKVPLQTPKQRYVHLRIAQAADILSLAECNERTLPENYNNRWYHQHLTDWPDLAFVVIEKESRVVAYLLGKTQEVPVDRKTAFDVGPDGNSSLLLRATRRYENVGHVSSLAVLPEFRRQGLASQLLDAFHERVERKCQSASLHCRTSNDAAVRLYEASGYGVSYTIPNYYEDGEDAYFMKKVFKPTTIFERLRPFQLLDLPKEIRLREFDENGKEYQEDEEPTQVLSGIL